LAKRLEKTCILLTEIVRLQGMLALFEDSIGHFVLAGDGNG